VEPIFYVPVGEVKALLTAIYGIGGPGFDNVIFTTNSKIAFDAFNINMHGASDFACLVADPPRSLCSLFLLLTLFFVCVVAFRLRWWWFRVVDVV